MRWRRLKRMIAAGPIAILLPYCLLQVAHSADRSTAATYHEAVRLLERGELTKADELFQKLTLTSELAGLASFARGNVAALRAKDPNRAEPQLRQAIHFYRQALQLGCAAPLSEEDVRFNLELVKKLRDQSKGASMEDTTSTSPDAKKSDEPGLPQADNRDSKPDQPEDKNSQSDEDIGLVHQPFPGIPFEDPGELTASRAQQILAESSERIKQQQPLRPGLPRIRRPSTDY